MATPSKVKVLFVKDLVQIARLKATDAAPRQTAGLETHKMIRSLNS